MSGQYKIKNCKYCNKEHRKRGPYCSQSCASTDREPTEAMREAMRKVAIDYNRTPEAAVKRNQLNTPLASMTIEDFAVDIPEVRDLSDYDDFLRGFDKASDW